MSHLKAAAALAVGVLMVLAAGCTSNRPEFNKPDNPGAISRLLKPPVNVTPQEGIAAAILLDTTGSMADEVKGADNQPKPKIKIAQAALLNVMRQFSAFARKNPDKKLLVGIYEFSQRAIGVPTCRQIVKMGPPDVPAAEKAVAMLVPSGSTPIGDAMIAAKRDLDATGFTHRHMLVITDGENNRGYLPGDVARVISQEPQPDRAAIYFIAFDIGADVFEPVKEAGGLVLSAAGEKQLTDTLDFILTGKILVEQPEVPAQPHPVIPGTRRR